MTLVTKRLALSLLSDNNKEKSAVSAKVNTLIERFIRAASFVDDLIWWLKISFFLLNLYLLSNTVLAVKEIIS